MSRLLNKTTFLTGGASGIGLAIASLFLSHGSNVYILYFSGDNITAAQAHLSSLFTTASASTSQLVFEQGDAADPPCLGKALDKCIDVFGGLDVVVLNAGVLPMMRSILEVKQEEWERVMRVNAFGREYPCLMHASCVCAQGVARMRGSRSS